MAQVVKHYCDFCGKEIAKEDIQRTGGVVGNKGEIYISVEIHNTDCCSSCYDEVENALAPFSDFVRTRVARSKLKTKEAAHE